MKVIHLFTSWYRAGNEFRQAELDECLRRNLMNPFIGRICLWKDSGSVRDPSHSKLIVREESVQPAFDDFFMWANELCGPEDIAIVSNTDIWFDETLETARGIEKKQAYAILRHEADGQLLTDERGEIHWGSQDAWVFRPPLPPMHADFGMGFLRNDNALAYRFWKRGFDLRNPAKSIRIHHLHGSEVRRNNYHAKQARIPPPWLLVEPTEIHEKGRFKFLRKTFSVKWALRKLRRNFKNSGNSCII